MGKKFASFDLRDGVLRVVLSYLPQVPDSGIDIKIEKTGRDEYTITTQVKKGQNPPRLAIEIASLPPAPPETEAVHAINGNGGKKKKRRR